jgi:hypothetical protein
LTFKKNLCIIKVWLNSFRADTGIEKKYRPAPFNGLNQANLSAPNFKRRMRRSCETDRSGRNESLAGGYRQRASGAGRLLCGTSSGKRA